MKSERQLRIRQRAICGLRTVFSEARSMGWTSKQMHQAIETRVYEPLAQLHAPRHLVRYVRGYERALHDALYETTLVYGTIIDGQFYSTHSAREDYYQKHGISPVAFATYTHEPGAPESTVGHYWPMPDGTVRPYFLG